MYIKKISGVIFFLLVAKSLLSNPPIENYKQKKAIEFIENKGQVIDSKGDLRKDILYVSDYAQGSIYLRKSGWSYVITETEGKKEDKETETKGMKSILNEQKALREKTFNTKISVERIDVDFEGANQNSEIISAEPTQGHTNYYLGHCPEGIKNIKGYQQITYKDLYKNIDISYYGKGEKSGIEYDLTVRPGGNPSEIKMKYTGADNIKIKNNKLIVTTYLGEIEEWIPKIYQKTGDKEKYIKGRYILKDNATVGIKVDEYDTTQTLIIDPQWITYYGGSGDETSRGIAVTTNGDIAIAGTTTSLNFPSSVGAFQNTLIGAIDAFVVMLDDNGNRLWGTYYGEGYSCGVASDPAGSIFLTGFTYSTNFPVSSGAFQSVNNGNGDAFIAKFDNLTGNALWSTYYGGSDFDYSTGVTADTKGNVLITGTTTSTDFPVSAGAFQGNSSEGGDAFIIKMDNNGNPLWTTYYGGSGSENSFGITSDLNNNIIISGFTGSTDFPLSQGAFQTSNKGLYDAYIVKMNETGNRLWATYYGGSGNDVGESIAGDANGSIVVTGLTGSDDFPISSGAFKTNYNAPFGATIQVAFVLKLDNNGNQLWSTFFGNGFVENYTGCTIDPQSNNIYLEIDSESQIDAWLPSTSSCSYQSGLIDAESLFISEFSPSGKILCSTFLGGPGEDDCGESYIGNDFVGSHLVAKNGYLYAAMDDNIRGGTGAVTSGAFQTTFGGGNLDVIIAKIIPCGSTKISNITVNSTTVCAGNGINFSSILLGDTSGVNYNWKFIGGTPVNSNLANPIGIVYPNSGTYLARLDISSPNVCTGNDSLTKNVTVFGLPTLNITGQTTICEGKSTTLSANGANSYIWIPSLTLSSSIGVVIIANPTIVTTYTITGSNTCGSSIGTIQVNVYSPLVDAGNNVTILKGETVQISASTPAMGASYSWIPSTDLDCNNCLVPKANPTITTKYYLTLTDANGCLATDSVIVSITEIICNDLFIPNSFSPNNDGNNDLFLVYGIKSCIEQYHLQIFNRWGNLVFNSIDLNEGWDGKYKGKALDSDVFVYQLIYSENNQTKTAKGNISLIR